MRGRDQQLAQIGGGLRSVAGTRRSRVLVVEALPGAGKTRLLMEAVRIAERRGFTIVKGVSVSAEVTAEAAIEVARERLRHGGEQAGTFVVLDDLHLTDDSTLTALCDLVTARSGRPVLWLLAFSLARGSAAFEPLKTFLARTRGRLPVESVREMGPLPSDALTQLVTDCAGAVPDPALLALADSVNDTPHAVIELVRGLVEDGDLSVVDGTARLRSGTLASAPAVAGVRSPEAVPKRFSALIQKDLRSLSAPTERALRLAAVLGSPFEPEDLSALLGEAPVSLLAAVDEAVDRGLLVCGERDLAFRSEPVWRVLLDSVPAPMCALLRRQAAKMLLSRPDGVARAALQLAHVARPGDAEDLRVLAEGSQRLLTVDPWAAAALATRCMELLAPGHAERVRLARIAVEAFTRAGELARAISLARETIEEAARLAVSLPQALAEDIAALQASMSTALLLLGNAPLARLAAGDALAAREGSLQLREAVIAHLAASYLTGDSTAVEQAREILRAPDRHAEGVRGGVMTFHAFGQWRDGRVGEAVGTLREAVVLHHVGEDERLLDPRWFLVFALTRTDEYEEAEAIVECSARESAVRTGTLAAAVPAVLQAQLHFARGRLDEAEEAARAGVGTDGPCVPMLAPQAWLVLAQIALRRGDLARVEECVGTLERDFPQEVSTPWWAARLLVSAQLAEARSDVRAAAKVLAEVGTESGALRELVLEDPAAAAWCVRCALAADMPDIARRVIDTMEILSARNQYVPAVLTAALHARGLVEKDTDALLRAGREHRNPWARAAAVEDHAGLLLDTGEHERAIGELDRALEAYGALGGERDAARVRARLRSLGVRRRHWTHTKRPLTGWESLTKTERKVAELVADGLTNQQAARHLFVSPHTVGFHLRQIYRKLGIRSRTALIRLKA
ncbi:LuxR C-terminal-related transcriptional regulator [Streptomyces brasiliscabiei]|uniref:LuxR C-terminal-related transcriptional regulator n=1 Tax=Streptomyces brasiliscabiei TaxID=2736302 RepID=UPI003014F0BE